MSHGSRTDLKGDTEVRLVQFELVPVAVIAVIHAPFSLSLVIRLGPVLLMLICEPRGWSDKRRFLVARGSRSGAQFGGQALVHDALTPPYQQTDPGQ